MDKPNVEKLVINWLNNMDDPAWPAHGDMPDPRPVKFILVDRTGGPREAMVLDRAEILIEVYHKSSRADCSDKASAIADALHELREIESITHASVNSVVKLDDLIGKYWRYQIYCDVFNRR